MTTPWEAGPILKHLASFLNVHGNLSLLLTFDDQGVSGHVNHVSLPLALLSAQSQPDFQLQLPPEYVLLSSPLSPKFISFVAWFMPLHASPSARYALDFAQYTQGVRAMLAHRSQMVWFRWLYISFSRYMWTNEFLPLAALSPALPSSTAPEPPLPPQEPVKDEL